MTKTYPSDIQIAQANEMEEIGEIGKKLDIPEEAMEKYGRYKAKINLDYLRSLEDKPDGKLILVTAINPTPAGEGKTTTSIGLADGLQKIGKVAALALREPSLGPAFGIKGGAAGGGHSQVMPMEDINLHFTGDFHAIELANNLLAAMIDNHIQQGNELNIDPRQIVWHRCMDMNDRQLRNVVTGLGGKSQGHPREGHFDITVASEVMAILCLASDLEDLKDRLASIVVAYTYDNEEVTCGDLKAQGAMTILLKDAIKPNLVQTLEHTPAFIHGGPFANIAHGCNSLMATRMALKTADYVVTEAGFGADLGAEKFFDIKCRAGGLQPSAVVIVATLRALKHHGGADKDKVTEPNMDALQAGLENLWRHADNIRSVFHLPVMVALNAFYNDPEEEVSYVMGACTARQLEVSYCTGWADGGAGMTDLAEKVVHIAEMDNAFSYAYSLDDSLKEKMEKVAQKVYRASEVKFTAAANRMIRRFEKNGYGDLPICFAKTQYSFSDDPKKINAPEDFIITVREVRLSAGAGFIVCLTGDIMTMPGLPKMPAAVNMDISNDGVITGLF